MRKAMCTALTLICSRVRMVVQLRSPPRSSPVLSRMASQCRSRSSGFSRQDRVGRVERNETTSLRRAATVLLEESPVEISLADISEVNHWCLCATLLVCTNQPLFYTWHTTVPQQHPLNFQLKIYHWGPSLYTVTKLYIRGRQPSIVHHSILSRVTEFLSTFRSQTIPPLHYILYCTENTKSWNLQWNPSIVDTLGTW